MLTDAADMMKCGVSLKPKDIWEKANMIYLNGKPLATTIFPDKTSQVWKLSEFILKETNWVSIHWEFSHEGEFMQLAQLKMLLDANHIASCLRIKYLPYGRQDKPISNDATFALTAFAYLLNHLRFGEVIIMDPHSVRAVEMIRNSRAIYPTEQLGEAMDMMDSNAVCYPDSGALTKYTKVYDISDYSYGEKVRDQLTGHITSYKLLGDVSGKNVMIVDDICDGGMTFKLLAKDLLAAGAKQVNLFVTHGIFSKGLQTLKESGINKVFTQDGEASEHNNQITYRRL